MVEQFRMAVQSRRPSQSQRSGASPRGAVGRSARVLPGPCCVGLSPKLGGRMGADIGPPVAPYPMWEYSSPNIPALSYAVTRTGHMRQKSGLFLVPVCATCFSQIRGLGRGRWRKHHPECRPVKIWVARSSSPFKWHAAIAALALGEPRAKVKATVGKASLHNAGRAILRWRGIPSCPKPLFYSLDSSAWPDVLITGQALVLFH